LLSDIKKVNVVPRLVNSHGNNSCTKKLTTELINPTKEIATALILFGNNSENITHITGPIDTANDVSDILVRDTDGVFKVRDVSTILSGLQTRL
jgi:hypothetical protein